MNVLVIGSGGREHAIVWKLSQSKDIKDIYCIPGNGGIEDLAACRDIKVNNFEELISFSKKNRIELVVVGPENPLADGIVDAFTDAKIPIFGPTKKAAQIESSKIFAKELMKKYGVPTAGFKTFFNYEEGKAFLNHINPPYVIKADGLCAGKGAYVVRNNDNGLEILKQLMMELIHGDAGKRIIIEDFLPGIEASYLSFTDGFTTLPMIPSQDHKPLLDDDRGPNTGGMGAYTPIPFVDNSMARFIDKEIMDKTIHALEKEGALYKGVLYAGLMLLDNKPYVIEFNARFGDPETQPILFKMKSDMLPILKACIDGNLKNIKEIEWKEGVSVCVVLASRGYPDKPEKGYVIKGLEDLKDRKDVMVFHAGTRKESGKYYTSGGRVLGVTVMGDDYKDAIKKAYEAVSCIEFEGMQYRKDIGAKALKLIYG
ncbi:MAG TPA: phosphoribosylamine--glycine ligase [Syntrophorhabdaceae bacterium]|nr:phosphoribosylamine--glycine ligase [Syntrophorhabdaceae bacterium]